MYDYLYSNNLICNRNLQFDPCRYNTEIFDLTEKPV